MSEGGGSVMTKAEIDAVLDRVKTWPRERQEEIAAALLQVEAGGAEVYRLSDEERLDIREGVAEADRGEFASAARLRSILSGR